MRQKFSTTSGTLCTSKRRETGFSLIEVLVSIVILGIGMLGAAGLQLATLRSNHFTAQASVATQLVRDYEEITQMLRSAAISSSEGTSALSGLDTATADSSTIPNCQTTTATCDSGQLATFMLNEWVALTSSAWVRPHTLYSAAQTMLPATSVSSCGAPI